MMISDTELQTAFRTASVEVVQERLQTAVSESFVQLRGTSTRAACRESYAADTFAAAAMTAGRSYEAAFLAALARFFGYFGGSQEVAVIGEILKRNGSLEVLGACLSALRIIGGTQASTVLRAISHESASDAVKLIARSELSKLESGTISSYREFIGRNQEPYVLKAAQFGVVDGRRDTCADAAAGFLQSPHSVAVLQKAGFKVLNR